MADGAGRVIKSRVIRVCERYRVSGPRRRFLDIDTQKVVERPPCSGAVSISLGAGVAIQKGLSVEHARVRIIDEVVVIYDALSLKLGFLFFQTLSEERLAIIASRFELAVVVTGFVWKRLAVGEQPWVYLIKFRAAI